jgi:hypothetical protein
MVPISGFKGTSLEGIKLKGQNPNEYCGIFSPCGSNAAPLNFLGTEACIPDGDKCMISVLCQWH